MQSLSGGLLDTDDVRFSANAQFIAKASHNAASHLTVEEARESLRSLLENFTKLWDVQTASYRRFDEMDQAAPSQYLALQQLIYRIEKAKPIMVAVAAPAGYGKSQIIIAWLTHLQTKNPVPKWVVLAVTGVAASNAGGTTIHAFFRMRKNAASGIFADPEAQDELREVCGLIIDEAFMADQETMFEVIKICTQVPLRQQLRQPGSLPLFGYRHVLMFGDLRQLPPASGNPPFWASETFQTYIEIFVLREDRRHEKDAEMRELKELIAWGGHAHKYALPKNQV